MKSYQSHLESRSVTSPRNLLQKPIYKSSAIFPVIRNESLTSLIEYVGYWFLKSNHVEIGVLATLRDVTGNIISRTNGTISEPKGYHISLDEMLGDMKNNFVGSIEVEFNSSRDMVFPYPALVLKYIGNDFMSCVHTTQRIYNDIEDHDDNEKYSVPETGFDIRTAHGIEPFFAFVNGTVPNDNAIFHYTVINSSSKTMSGSFSIGAISKYQTCFVYLKKFIPYIGDFLGTSPGTISLQHNLSGFFVRFLAGNFDGQSPSFTHSYYDCSHSTNHTDYWKLKHPEYHDSAAYIPLFLNEKSTELVMYPNQSPSSYKATISIFDGMGNNIADMVEHVTGNKLTRVTFDSLHDMIRHDARAAQITTSSQDPLPSRIKYGLNVGINSKKYSLPCNICFNSYLYDPNITRKKGSFHWAPITSRNSCITIGNFSTRKNYNMPALVELQYYRKKDTQTKRQLIDIPPNTDSKIFSNGMTDEMMDGMTDDFMDEGWVTIKSDNPFVTGFYFNFEESGSVAGDHFF